MKKQIDEYETELTRLKQANSQLETELAIINSIQQGLASRLEVQEIYDLLGEKIRRIFNAQVVMISTYDPVTHTVMHRYAIERGVRVYNPGPHPPGGFRSKIIETCQPVLVNTNVAAEAERLGQPTLPGTITPKSWLGVPTFIGDQVTGILSLQNVEQENAFRGSDLRLLKTLAASMSLALENARLWEQEDLYRKALEREFEIGRQIQAGFLPDSVPQPKGWEIAAILKPAREVAGDFYDVFRLPHGRIGLVIADVCDKGLGAALFMTLFRSLIRAASNIGFHERKDNQTRKTTADHLINAISFTNNYIHQTHGRTSMFATIFYGILDLHDGILTYINAGHLPPILVDQTGMVTHLRPTGPAVGVIPDTYYKINKIRVQPGDTLFSYTDGVTDTAKFTGETLSLDALLPFINQDNSLQRILEKIQDDIETFAEGVKQIDDITMLAIRRKQTEQNGYLSD